MPSAAAEPLLHWLIDAADEPLVPDAGSIAGAFSQRLVDLGARVWRTSTSLPTLHPEVFVRNVVWTRDGGTEASLVPHSIVGSSSYRGSPVERIHAGSPAFRVRLTDPAERARFRVLAELASRGATDYFIAPLRFQGGRISYFAWASDHPDGFREEDLALFEASLPLLTLRLQLESGEFATRSLLSVYLGDNAAARVLSGQVQRGTGTNINAAIVFYDLRGFTELSDRRSGREVVSLLDRYFEAVGGPIADNGGEILKFIGDAVLAIFPVEQAGERDCCARAVKATRAGFDALDALNRTLPDEPLRIGAALHLGEVMYGNIGARARLDFTVIGRAVNEASRVESLCKALGQQVLLTARFARALGGEGLVSLGFHTLRGVSEPQELFTPARG